MRLSDLLMAFKGCDKVIFRLTGCGEQEHETAEFKDAIEAIEALQHENEQLRAKLGDWKYEVQCHMDEVTAMDKENEQLRAQVARMKEALDLRLRKSTSRDSGIN